MSVKIGFAILSHERPEQLLRLVETLHAMFAAPPIACHHDFGQCPLDEARFPASVRFVRPHLATAWGDISLPMAALRALGVLRACGRPDWYFLLSGCDYPVRPATEIRSELSAANCDAYLDHREIPDCGRPPGQAAEDGGFGRPDWVSLAYARYCACRRPTRALLRQALRGGPFSRTDFVPIENRAINRICRSLQRHRPPHVYGGDFWLHANRKAIDRLLDDPSLSGLVHYYRMRQSPAESLFHTVLCNQGDLRVGTDHRRYTDWTAGGRHPKWLEVSDMQRIVLSGAYFARKLRDADLCDLLDATRLRPRG